MQFLKYAAAGAIMAALPLSAQAAPLIDVEVGAALWSHSPSGWVSVEGDRFDLEDELGLGREQRGFVWALLQHPVPALPNVKLRYNPLSFSGTGTVTATRNFGPITIGGNTEVQSRAKLDHLDAILYYQPLDNWVSLGFGLNIKLFDGEFHIQETADPDNSHTETFSGPLPLLYLNAAFEFPATGLSVRFEGSGIAYSGNRIIDASAAVRYQVLPLLHVEAGYRRLELRIDEFDDIDADMRIDGPYAGLLLRF
jgi:outer membrane protein